MNTAFEYINPEYLDLMTEGDVDTKKVILEMLFEELPSELSRMRDLNDSKNWEELWQASHKMKSTLPFVGNEEMIATNINIEQSAKEENEVEEIKDLLDKLDDLYPKALAELKEIHQSL